MPVFRKGNFSIDLGFFSVGGELDEEDRQLAWQLYTEIMTRVGVRGKVDRDGKDLFDGEVYVESLDSVYRFFQRSRELMAAFPVGKIGATDKNHLGYFIAEMLEIVLRPFLESWQAAYRTWWKRQEARLAAEHPFTIQADFPLLAEMLEDWANVRAFCRDAATELTRVHKLKDVRNLVPPRERDSWNQRIRKIAETIRVETAGEE